ncbi:HAMP domain-containing histidine kinase [bacterium]|nr:HAMP domain-containing histidine kinase [bacterium]
MPLRIPEHLRLPAIESFHGPIEALMALNRWFVRIRWAAVAALFIILAATRWLVGIGLPLDLLMGLGVVLAVYNLIFYWFLEDLEGRAPKEITYQRASQFANVQVAADLICMTVLLHFAGGVENPLSTFYVFHVVIASIMLGRGQSTLQALLALTLFTGLALFEYTGLIPHHHLPLFITAEQYRNWRFVLGHGAVLAVMLFLAAFFTTSLARRLREQQAELADTSNRLAGLEARKSRFMRLAAHQLRAPLSAIRSLLNITLGDYKGMDEAKRREVIQRAETRTEQLLDLLSDLLSLSHLRDARLETHALTLIPVDETVSRVVEFYRPQATEKRQDLTVQLGAGDATVLAEEARLRDVFTNLVSNAVKYTPDGGEVRVTTRGDNDTIVCEVADTGIGIPPADQEHLFEEFFRAANAREFTREGTGLGLSIIREIVERAGGAITCESRPRDGTRFTVTLPLAACSLRKHPASRTRAPLPAPPAT